MIYIFKGIQSICSLPGMACKACGECCAQMNCNWIKDLCNGCGSAVTHFFERPLSTYVVISIIESALLIYTASLAMDPTDEAVKACKYDGKLDGSTFVYAQMGMGVVCIIFAFYFQRAVWGKIMETVKDDMLATTDPVPPPGAAPSRFAGLTGGQTNAAEPLSEGYVEKVCIKKKTVQDAFKNIFCEDFFVLGYFILLAANAGLATVTMTPGCPGLLEPYGVMIPKSMFFLFCLYAAGYYCCECCANKVEIEKAEAAGGSPVE
jgi:hypothetical protein